MSGPVKRRSYDRLGRQAQSGGTRQRIVVAARAMMLERGYRATTVTDIARQAGVNVDTVYQLVGRKPVLLREVIEQAISGVDRVVVAEDRDYVEAMQAEADPRKKLIIYAGAIREIQSRMAPLFLVLRDASTTEPEAKQVWEQISERRATNMRKLAQDLDAAGGLRSGLTIDEAADVIWATNGPELYVLLTVERGWSSNRYEQWLGDMWCRVLLPEPLMKT